MSNLTVNRWLEEFSRKRKEPGWMLRLRKKAFQYFQQLPKSEMEPEFDLEVLMYTLEHNEPPVSEIDELAPQVRSQLDKLGLSEEEKEILTGVAVNVDNSLIYSTLSNELKKKNVLVTSTDEAVQKFDWMKDYIFRILDYKSNRIAALHTAFWAGGVLLRVPSGVKIPYPVNAFFLIISEGIGQTEHSMVIADPGSEIHYTEGCVAPTVAKYSVHLGGNEIFVHQGAKVYATALENWVGRVAHTPVKASLVEDNASLTEVSITLGGTKVISRPTVYIHGKNAKAVLQSVSFIDKDRQVYGGGKIIHFAGNSSSELLNRGVVKDNGFEHFLGRIEVEKDAAKVKGHMACNSYLLNPGAKSYTTPELFTKNDNVELSHEATVGRIGEEQLFYLESMGFSEDEALSLIVNGFFAPALKDVPFEYVVEVKKIIDLAMKGA
ncbi:MAG: Fe-S cluster assembly protein SufB [Candidatus Asgardarchaeia archaeon]